MITKLKRVPPDEFLKSVRTSISVLQERFTDEALLALYEKIAQLHIAPMPNYLMVDTILKDWQEFDTVEAAETYCNIKMIYVPALRIRLKTGVLVQSYMIWPRGGKR
jgi:hypothetical protein